MNWKNIFNFLLLIVVYLGCSAQEPWEQALAQMDEHDYAAARATLEGMHPKGYGPWYALGSLYEKQKEMPRALTAYRHAQKEASFGTLLQIVPALERVSSATGNSFNRFNEYAKTFLLLSWLLIFQLLFLLSWCLMLYTLRRKKRAIFIFLSLFLTIIFGMLCFMRRSLERQRLAVVMEDVVVRIGPSSTYQQREQFKAGAEVMVEDESKDASWVKIKRGDIFGWIPAQTIEQI